MADAFGVRAGSLVTLPVLMNDHDPNEDVLSVDPISVTGLDPGFGAVSITDDSQRLTVQVAPGAAGTATFSYAVSDGTAQGGLLSPPTTVTLTVSSADSAPQWCGVEACLVPWPAPEVAPGGTITVPVLPGWVDPDGDPVLLLSVQNPSGVGTRGGHSGRRRRLSAQRWRRRGRGARRTRRHGVGHRRADLARSPSWCGCSRSPPSR